MVASTVAALRRRAGAPAGEGRGPLKLSPGKGPAPLKLAPGKGPAPLATARAGCGRGERGGSSRSGGTLARESPIRHRSTTGVRRIRDGSRTRHEDVENSSVSPMLSNGDGGAVDLTSAYRTLGRPHVPGP